MWKWSDLKRFLSKSAPVADFSNDAFVMWPAMYTGNNAPENPHCTILYLGKIDEMPLHVTKQTVIDAIKRVPGYNSYILSGIEGLEYFGEEKNIPVLLLDHHFIFKFQRELKLNMAVDGIPVDDKFPVYRPHVTITPEAALNKDWPQNILLGPVELWWGNDHYRTAE